MTIKVITLEKDPEMVNEEGVAIQVYVVECNNLEEVNKLHKALFKIEDLVFEDDE